MKITRTLLNFCLIPLLMVGLFLPAPTFQAAGAGAGRPFSPAARQALADFPSGERASFIITLRGQLTSLAAQAGGASPLQAAAALPGKAARRRAVIEALQGYANQQQAGLMAQARSLQSLGQVGQLIPFWIFNGVSLEATPAAIRALADRPEVARVDLDPDPNRRILPLGDAPASPAGLTTTSPEPNVALVNAPALWSLGYTGQGVVVASLDTGVDVTHPDLAPGYRGGTNSWFDPYGQNPTPADNAGIYTGHGTMTMGLMVGGSNGGTTIGMAPGAKWISAKIFNNSGGATFTAIHLAFQWVLNPNNNPADPGVADVVNNSWGYTPLHFCDTTFQPDIQALLAADILPVFSAGNSGPGPQTDTSPANLPGTFSVGAVDNNDNIAGFSSRGPGACGSTQPFPYLVAPGVSLHTSYLNNQYHSCDGTSCAAPEVSGALALLLSAVPHLSANIQQEALVQSAKHLAPTVPDAATGYGRLDVLQAYNWLITPLVVPNNLQAEAVSAAQIDLTWMDTNANETGYEVQRFSNGLDAWVSIATTGVNAVSYSDSSDLVEGTAYYYRVRAVNTSLGYNSNFDTTSATTLLLPPTSFSAAAVSPSQVDLSWINNSAYAGGTVVQRSPDGLSGWTNLGVAGAGDTTFSDSSGLVEGAAYYYRIQTVNANQTLASPFISASAVVPLLAPSSLMAVPFTNNQVNLYWTDHSTHATGYEVQRSPDALTGWVTLTAGLPGDATSYSDPTVASGMVYYYQVRATGAVPGSQSQFAPAAHTVTGPYWMYVAIIYR